MFNLLAKHAEAYSRESFRCHSCNQDFEASIITWVDVSKTPQARTAILNWDFNNIQCNQCGYRHFSNTPFFFEDFEQGLLVAVFPAIPEQRAEVENAVREKYGYYPVLEFFYDMTQIWMLVYFLEYYKKNKNILALTRLGGREERLRKILRFLKEDPMMITIREKLTETLLGYAASDDLDEILSRAACMLEEMLPWPLDRRCKCGADLSTEFVCCGKQIDMNEHAPRLSPHYVIYCPSCSQSFSGASCAKCGKVYTWKLGTVPAYKPGESMPLRTIAPLDPKTPDNRTPQQPGRCQAK